MSQLLSFQKTQQFGKTSLQTFSSAGKQTDQGIKLFAGTFCILVNRLKIIK